MSEPKPLASLSSGLLARKGSAKPAMRPQGFASFGANLDDLGWNDMGHPQTQEEHVPSSIAALTPVGGRSQVEQPSDNEHADEASEAYIQPPVVEQQRILEASFREQQTAAKPRAIYAVPETPAAVVSLPARTAIAARPNGRKAAFTLRLDSERHLKLRLACAVTHRSAQQLLIGALDELLNSMPEVQVLADRVPAAGKGSR